MQVYQAIAAYSSRLDNIVEFYGTINLPQLPGLPPVDPIVLTASLKHYFEPVGGSTVSITFEDTEVKGTGEPCCPADWRRCDTISLIAVRKAGEQKLTVCTTTVSTPLSGVPLSGVSL